NALQKSGACLIHELLNGEFRAMRLRVQPHTERRAVSSKTDAHSNLPLKLKALQGSTGFLLYSAVQPPSKAIAEPVMKLEASEAMKVLTPLSSSGRPQRPSGMLSTKN